MHVRNRISFGRSETDLSSGVVGEHNLDFESDDTLSEHDVSDGGVDVLGDGVTGVDHESVGELHGLRSLASQFAGDDDFATLKLIFIIPDLLLLSFLKSRSRLRLPVEVILAASFATLLQAASAFSILKQVQEIDLLITLAPDSMMNRRTP